MADEVRRGAAQDQEAGRVVRAVRKPAQYGKQFRQDLDLIQDHQPRKGAQGQLRVLQSALIHR